MVEDLEDVVDAAGVDRFALLGISQGCAVSVAYAVRHPERVSRLILYGGFVKGYRVAGDAEQMAQWSALGTLMREGWGQNNPAFRQLFTSLFVPGATQHQMDWFTDMQRKSVSPANAERLNQAFGDFDVVGLLPQVRTPTLVLHAREDAVIPIKAGRPFAKLIPGARFVSLESSNHILLAHEPAFAQFLEEIHGFLATQ
jgi:pimeloyl-ACP methyl ester carboxylesterase